MRACANATILSCLNAYAEGGIPVQLSASDRNGGWDRLFRADTVYYIDVLHPHSHTYIKATKSSASRQKPSANTSVILQQA